MGLFRKRVIELGRCYLPILKWKDRITVQSSPSKGIRMHQNLPITQTGFDKMVQELDQLKKVERPAIIQAVAEARSHGDISENAEYHAAREKQSHIETRISYLEDKIARAQIITVNTQNAESIVFGCKVKVKDLDDDYEEEYELVGAGETDPSLGRISTVSPIGKALIGKRSGDVVTVETPGGILKLQIVEFA
jgi:transcription elongation factor GreA